MTDGNGNEFSARIKAGAAVAALALSLAAGLVGYGVAKGANDQRLEAMAAHQADQERRLSTVERDFAYMRGRIDAIADKLGVK